MAKGEVKVIDAGTSAIIVRVDAIAPPDPADPQVVANRTQLGEAAAAGIAQDLFGAFADTLQRATKVEINQAAVNAVHAQFQ
jgi:peptidyl-prolyl cis-trans isomerase D